MQQQKEKPWKHIIRKWEKSGLAMREFCVAERIPLSTFRFWKKRIKDTEEESKFVRVDTTERPLREITISYECGIRLTVPDAIPHEALSRIIGAVSAAL